MKIVADQDIFAVEPLFAPLGELVLLPGRSISRRDIIDADALLVRSFLPVDRSLLAGTAVKFAGTATSGTDHMDVDWLREAGIALAHTRGANANAVVEYCLGALAGLVLERRIDRSARSIGIIGAGEIGSRLARRMNALGYAVTVCDPPLAQAGGSDFDYQPMEAALNCEIVSLHVPLSIQGPHATAGLLDANALAQLPPGAVLLNASRGGVVDERALLARLAQGDALHCVIDVWENEPRINAALASKASLATPHIAGYSEQAKWAAGKLLARQLARHFDLPESAEPESGGSGESIVLSSAWPADDLVQWRIIERCLPLADVSSTLTRWAGGISPDSDSSLPAKEFDQMRKPFLRRQEFAATCLCGSELLSQQQRNWLRQAGFQLQPAR